MDKLTVEKVVKDIEDNKWWTEEAPGIFQLTINFMDAFASYGRHIGLPFHTLFVGVMRKNFFWEETKEQEKADTFMHVLKEIKKDKNYLKKLFAKWMDNEKKMKAVFSEIDRTGLKKASNKKLWEIYKKILDLCIIHCELAIIPEGGDPIPEHCLIPLLKKQGVKESNIHNLLVVCAAPVEPSFMDIERLSYLNLCLVYSGNREKFRKELDKHAKKYFWINNNYLKTKVLDANHFLSHIKEDMKKKSEEDIKKEIKQIKEHAKEVKEKKEAMFRKYSLNDEIKAIFGILEFFGYWIDKRKELMLMYNHYMVLLLEEIAARNNFTWNEIGYYTEDEIKKLLLENRKVDKKVLKERYNDCAYVTTRKEKILFSGKDALRIREAFEKKLSRDMIKGMVASKGQGSFTGEVCVIRNPHEDEFIEGSILVTSMTRPDFVPLIKKAKAIITDEGGVTCHAAIVSREFGIPCIIGTKNATKVLETGDCVEMDIDSGIIRKL